MVLEYLIKERNPFIIFLIGFIYAFLGLIFGFFLFYENVSITMVFITSLACFYLVFSLIKREEKYDVKLKKEFSILKKHFHLIILFLMLFLGFFFSYLVSSLILPEEISDHIFQNQNEAISSINSKIYGKAIEDNTMFNIFFHNLQVLLVFIIFSFLFGAGAIFLITYNASIGGFFIGQFIKNQILTHSGLSSFLIGLVRYFPHAVLEFGGYFVGAIAGGIISVAIVKHHYKSKHFSNIMIDAGTLTFGAILILFLAAFVEVYITPFLVETLSKILI